MTSACVLFTRSTVYRNFPPRTCTIRTYTNLIPWMSTNRPFSPPSPDLWPSLGRQCRDFTPAERTRSRVLTIGDGHSLSLQSPGAATGNSSRRKPDYLTTRLSGSGNKNANNARRASPSAKQDPLEAHAATVDDPLRPLPRSTSAACFAPRLSRPHPTRRSGPRKAHPAPIGIPRAPVVEQSHRAR